MDCLEGRGAGWELPLPLSDHWALLGGDAFLTKTTGGKASMLTPPFRVGEARARPGLAGTRGSARTRGLRGPCQPTARTPARVRPVPPALTSWKPSVGDGHPSPQRKGVCFPNAELQTQTFTRSSVTKSTFHATGLHEGRSRASLSGPAAGLQSSLTESLSGQSTAPA